MPDNILTSPESPREEAPVESCTLPDPPFAPLPAVANDISPEVEKDDAPDVKEMAPPVRPFALELAPPLISTAPPTAIEPSAAPPVTDTAPPIPPVA